MTGRASALLALVLVAPAVWVADPGAAGLAAQVTSESELGERVTRVEGRVAFRVELREDVQVCEEGVRTGDRRGWGRWNGDTGACSVGVANVELEVRRGRVEAVELVPWLGKGGGGARDLGPASAETALAFLVGLADGGSVVALADAAKHGLMVTGLLRGVDAWPFLLEVARNGAVEDEVRRSALFWVGQEAVDRVAAPRVAFGLSELVMDDDEEVNVREAAVFALSQRPADEAVPALMEAVRSARDPAVRRSALFWLSQHDTPEVIRFFEAILSGG